MTFPLGTLSHGTKLAVEGLSVSLYFELEAIGGRVNIVEPVMIVTDFSGRSFDFVKEPSIDEYQNFVGKTMRSMGKSSLLRDDPKIRP